jgi:hypothetical protein
MRIAIIKICIDVAISGQTQGGKGVQNEQGRKARCANVANVSDGGNLPNLHDVYVHVCTLYTVVSFACSLCHLRHPSVVDISYLCPPIMSKKLPTEQNPLLENSGSSRINK